MWLSVAPALQAVYTHKMEWREANTKIKMRSYLRCGVAAGLAPLAGCFICCFNGARKAAVLAV
jgi:hypothetical protein